MADSGKPVLGSLYVYVPNVEAPIFFAAAYFLSAIFHLIQCIRFGAWKLMGIHMACALVLTAGYALREWSVRNNNFMYSSTDGLPLNLYIASQVCIFVCPPLLELANYIILNRIFTYAAFLAPVAPGRITQIFGGMMGLVEGLNGSGVALTANAKATETAHNIGHYLTLASLCIQIVVILSFYTLAFFFHRRCIAAKILPRAVRAPLFVLYCSMALIFARCIYRLAEYTTGGTSINLSDYHALLSLSPLLRYEVFFFVFEASLILVNSALWNVFHAGRYLPRDKAIVLSQDGRTERFADESEPGQGGKQKSSGLASFGAIGLIMKIVRAVQRSSASSSSSYSSAPHHSHHSHQRLDSEAQELTDMRASSGNSSHLPHHYHD